MAIPVLCQIGLLAGEMYLNQESQRLAIIEHNELEASALVLNLLATSDLSWSIIFDETMRGQAVRRAEFQTNQKSLDRMLEALRNLPTQSALTKQIYTYASTVVSVLAESEMDADAQSNEQGEISGLFERLQKVRKIASDYIVNFQHLLDGLNQQRVLIHSVRQQTERQNQLVQQFLIISLVFDAIIALTLPIIFLNDITRRLGLLLENAKRLPTNEPLSESMGGRDELTFLNITLCNVAARLREAEKSKQLLMDMLAHDIRSPLTSAELLIYDVVEQKFQYSENVQQKISRLHTIFKQIKRLVEDLLSIERLEDGDFDLNIDFFDIIQLAQISLQTVEPQMRAKKLDVEFKTTETVIEVAADRERLLQVFDNLLSNAVKHSPNSGSIRVTLSSASQKVTVGIADQGQGIPHGKLQKVFERQFQTEKGRGQGGFGLGLSIAKQIIVKHGGTIEVQNVRPHGCLVTFSLPKDSEV